MKHILVQVDEVPRVFPDTRKVRANVAAPKAGASPSREIDALFPRLSSARHAYGQASLVPILTGRQGELASESGVSFRIENFTGHQPIKSHFRQETNNDRTSVPHSLKRG